MGEKKHMFSGTTSAALKEFPCTETLFLTFVQKNKNYCKRALAAEGWKKSFYNLKKK